MEDLMRKELVFQGKEIITIPIEKIDIPILMAIWYKEYMPIYGSKREVDGKMCVDLIKIWEED